MPPSDPARPDDALLPEEVLLDWAEGRISPEKAAELAARSGRAGLSERMAQMQADRATLRSLPILKAPPQLLERTLAALERDSLIGIAAGTPIDDHPPISMAEYKARHGGKSLRRAWPMRLAMAAGFTLLVGGAGFLAVQTFAPRSGSRTGPIAMHPGGTEAGAELFDAAEAPNAKVSSLSTPTDAPTPTLAADTASEAAPLPIDAVRAAALAREGRLLLRVGPARTDAVERLAAKDRSWRITRSVPPPMQEAVARAASDRSRLSPTVMADARGGETARAQRQARAVEGLAPLIGPGAAHSFMAAPSASLVPAAYICETDTSAAALDAVKAALESRLKAEVSFEELSEALPPPAPETAADVLWWTRAPAKWSAKSAVPVLIDRK